MKKRLIIILLIILVVAVMAVSFIVSRNNKDISELKVIAEKSYINYAWGVQYEGEAILSDGTIVKWSNYDTYPLLQEMTEKSNWIINNSDIKIEKVSNKDLKELNQYISKIKDEFKYEGSQGADMGSNCVKIYNYEEETILKLSEQGDNVGKNNSEEAKRCLDLIEKYL